MTVEFKFDINQVVRLPQGDQTGVVTQMAVAKGMSVNRVCVQYADKNGAMFEFWFDEDQLQAM